MNELIAIETNSINGEAVQTVNARDLYEFLGSKRGFAHWISERVEQYNFVENQDYVILGKTAQNTRRGRSSNDYAISIDMAKELSMVERSPKGKEARQYFIQCEKKLMATLQPQLPQTYIESLEALLESKKNEEALSLKIEQDAPKVAFVDSYVDTTGLMGFRQVAKLLDVKEATLRAFLVKKGYMYVLGGCWTFNHYFKDSGYGVVKTFTTAWGNSKTSVKFTPKGVEMLARRIVQLDKCAA